MFKVKLSTANFVLMFLENSNISGQSHESLERSLLSTYDSQQLSNGLLPYYIVTSSFYSKFIFSTCE